MGDLISPRVSTPNPASADHYPPNPQHHGSFSFSTLIPRRRQLRHLTVLLLSVALLIWTGFFYFQSTIDSVVPDDLKPSIFPDDAAVIANETGKAVSSSNNPTYQEPNWPQFATWSLDGWVKNQTPSPFLQGLQSYTTMGHRLEELPSLFPPHQGTITAMIHITIRDAVKPQLAALTSQTQRIDEIVIVCPTFLKGTVEKNVQKYTEQPSAYVFRIITTDPPQYSPGSVGSAGWLQVLPTIESDWVWVVDEGVIPGKRYLEYMTGMMHTGEYQNALLGTNGVLLPANVNPDPAFNILCLPEAMLKEVIPSVTQPVDMIQGAWLFRRQWLPFLTTDADLLNAPLAYHISQNLLYHASVPSIALPPHPSPDYQLENVKCASIQKETDQPAWKDIFDRRVWPTSLDRRQRTFMEQDAVLFSVDGPEQAIALYPLICRYETLVHVVVTGADRGLSGQGFKKALAASSCSNAPLVVVHDLNVPPKDELSAASSIAMGISHIAAVLQPSALIHLRQDRPLYHVVDALIGARGITTIGLPPGEVRHALWIRDLEKHTLKHWNDIKIDVVVITDRRPHSLSRLLQSASRSFYLGDTVDLKVHLEQSADRVTRMLVNGFTWSHGPKTVRHRIRKGGLMPAIVESWYPTSDDNYAVLLEDDIEVSPLFYIWAKYSILRYRYTAKHVDKEAQHMYGISLYSPRHLELNPEGRRPFDPNQAIGPSYDPRVPYLSQVPCSWGAVYFPEHWREFHSYLTNRLEDLEQDKLLNITVPGSRSERWKKSWKKYFIELVYLRSYVMLYPNFQLFESFSTNHLEFGTHVKQEQGRVNALDEFLVPLMQRDTILSQLPNNRLPLFADLPILDLWGKLSTLEELDTIGANWHKNVSSCPRTVGKFDAQDLLCPFTKHKHGKKVAAKKPKKPMDTIEAVEPLEFVEMSVEEGADPADSLMEEDQYTPTPIDVSQMSSPEIDQLNKDDEIVALEQDVEALSHLVDPQWLEETANRQQQQ
ncbi:hypothetical protein BX666DRAFT_2025975 [Dichotomocladium elegans]|nr:hypothetical protein BX666DRAFT_2025975 [Dichotomocladium elegans]